MDPAEMRGYTYVRALSKSGEGDVCLHEKDGALFVVKTVSRLNDEQAGILNRIRSFESGYFPRIVECVDAGGQTTVILEYIEGSTLHDEIRKNGTFSLRRAREILLEICKALKVLHNARPNPIIYRDLKPKNVIITPVGGVKLIDFGIARYHKADAARDTMLAGTQGYTAPEVMAGLQSDERSDVYSLGLVFYEMLSGKSLLDPPY